MLRRFGTYGILGWAVEMVFTGTAAAISGDPSATGKSYLWMHPIYGAGGLVLERTSVWTRRLPLPARAAIYASLMYVIEYGTGAVLRAVLGRCPWDYGRCRRTLHGLIRFDYLPAWYFLGLLFEPTRDLVRSVEQAITPVAEPLQPGRSGPAPTLAGLPSLTAESRAAS